MLKLFRERKKFVDGHEKIKANLDPYEKAFDIFDYESVIASPALIELRSRNLIKFISIIFEEILIKNIDKKIRDEDLAVCKNFFSNEMILISLKAYYNLKAR